VTNATEKRNSSHNCIGFLGDQQLKSSKHAQGDNNSQQEGQVN